MTTEDLLKPRYKVVADYPESNFIVGRIITPDTDYWIRSDLKLCPEYVANYPHLFKPLQWWEERRIEEMPEYIKIRNTFFKVSEYRFKFGVVIVEQITGHYIDYNLSDSIPASKEEFNNQQKK